MHTRWGRWAPGGELASEMASLCCQSSRACVRACACHHACCTSLDFFTGQETRLRCARHNKGEGAGSVALVTGREMNPHVHFLPAATTSSAQVHALPLAAAALRSTPSAKISSDPCSKLTKAAHDSGTAPLLEVPACRVKSRIQFGTNATAGSRSFVLPVRSTPADPPVGSGQCIYTTRIDLRGPSTMHPMDR